uniref:NADH dehydrogenase subunit 2 n=1 Tax=Nitzschia sp. (in: diatoms) TaxID=1884248 RepID=A0A2U9GJ26_9STRA|nr:NADH dehydrogenase subunit 2 [Nitzschia sp. (in: diatoms)]AWQ64313.1 NADH dehydrogenase subunit 2 [Nitzschia sp. (in: diatoms)]
MPLELFQFQIYHLTEMSLSAELFLSCSILQLTFYAISTAYNRKAGFVILNSQIYYIGTLLIILSCFLILNEDLLVMNISTSNNFIINDYFSFASKLTICVTSIFFLLLINISFRDEPAQNNFEYVVLITISILGLLLLCSANDLITAYLAIELHSIAFYIMAAFKRNSSYSIESGLKYFIIGALSSTLFLFGSAVVYGCMGSLSFDDLQMFFSLLSLDNTSVSSPMSLELVNNYSANELTLGSYEMVYDQSIFGLIEACDKSSTSTIVSSTEGEGLIEWCAKNKLSDVLLVFPSFALVSSLVSPGVEYFNSLIAFNSSWFAIQQNSVLVAKATDYSCASLSSLDTNGVSASLLLLKYILSSYNNMEVVGAVNGLATLNTELVSIGFILICISLFIKLSIAPFHYWSLDVYEGSPNTTTFFFAVVPKMALFMLLLRLCYISFYPIFVGNFQVYFFVFAVLSVFVGSIGGLEQRKLKTLLAYSSISHTGYLLLSFSTGNIEGVQMMFYYLVIYMVSGLCFWAVYLFLIQKRTSYFNKTNKELGDLVLLNESNPMLALIMAITLFSMAGIPPIVGFLAKVGIFLVVVKSSAYLIALLSILFSVISTFYYIRVIKILYFENTLIGKLYLPITTEKALIISVLSLLLIILCIDPMIIYLLFYKATLLMS